MRNRRGRWVLHESGCQKIEACSASFFHACQSRLKKEGVPVTKYIPWMASPYLAKEAATSKDLPIIENENVFCIDRLFLKNMQGFIDRAQEKAGMDPMKDIGLFHNIAEIGSDSIDVYHQAMALQSNWPIWMQRTWNALVHSVIPINRISSQKEDGRSFSDHHFIGGVFTGVDPRSPFPDLTLNITFAHELGHQALMIYQLSGDLLKDDDRWIYSGVRKTLRPAASAFHAAVALAYMVEAAESLLAVETITTRVAYLKAILSDYVRGLRLGTDALDDVAKTDLGEIIYADIKNRALTS